MEIEELEEAKKVEDKTLPAHSCAGDFSVPSLPLLPQLSSHPLHWRKFLPVRLAGSLALLGVALVFSPVGLLKPTQPISLPKRQDSRHGLPSLP